MTGSKDKAKSKVYLKIYVSRKTKLNSKYLNRISKERKTMKRLWMQKNCKKFRNKIIKNRVNKDFY